MADKYIIFEPSGRLGNAFFRYLGCVMFMIKDPTYKYILYDNHHDKTEYTFYPGKDCVSNDVTYVPNQGPNELKQICKYKPSVRGFNTLGFIKKNIDIRRLESNDYINLQNGHGLFVKNNVIVDDSNFLEMLSEPDLFGANLLMQGYMGYFQRDLNNKVEILAFIQNHKNEHYIKTDRNILHLMNTLIDDIEIPIVYDLVIHIRLGDFNQLVDFIEYEYLEKVLETAYINQELNGKNAIVIEPPTTEIDKQYLNKCVEWFQSKNISVTIESNSLMVDFHIMKQAKILINSMSTLAWTAAYLSTKLEKCYMPNYNFFDNPNMMHKTFKYPIENTLFYDVKTTKYL